VNPWNEDVKLDVGMAVTLIEEQFQNLKVTNIVFLGSGFDNNVYQINNKYLFRFPRRTIANILLKKEGNILPIIKQYLNTPIPFPVFFGEPAGGYPYNFLGYEYMQGKSVEEVLSVDSFNSIRILADFLSTLHSIPIGKVLETVGYDEFERVNISKRKNAFMENIKAIKKLDIYNTAQLKEYVSALPDIQADEEKVLVHGDLHIRNLLYDCNGVVSSVIDFGDVHVGNKACDLAIVYSFIPSEYRNLFFEIYGEVEKSTLILAKFRAILTSTYLLLHGHDSGNVRLVEKVKQSLDIALN
jgi:aminoglycoside phosphotransferase (APT) family kinase protein